MSETFFINAQRVKVDEKNQRDDDEQSKGKLKG